MAECDGLVKGDSGGRHCREDVLRAYLQKKPRNPKVMSQLACLLADKKDNNNPDEQIQKEERQQEALSLAQKAIEIAPQKPFGYAAISTISRDADERMKALKQAVTACGPSDPSSGVTPAFCVIPKAGFLVRLLVETRESESERARGIIGGGSSTHPNRRALSDEESLLYQKIQVALNDAWTNCRQGGSREEQTNFLVKLEYRLGLFFRKLLPPELCKPRAEKHLRRAVDEIPSHHPLRNTAQFWLGTVSRDASIDLERCPEEYVVGLYSTFSERFDELMVNKLAYSTPTKLRKLYDQVRTTDKADVQQAADLGCGTGLSGEAFRDVVKGKLRGVDLSPEMVDKAKARGIYDDLVVGDVTSILGHEMYDLVIACDVFVYLGDLQKVFEAARESLSKNGFFCFSTEHLREDHESHGRPYALHDCARFSHSRRYIEELAAQTGFCICKLEVCPIRKNQGRDVIGMLIILRLHATAGVVG